MLFSHRTVINEHTIKIHDEKINEVATTKFLGVIIDKKISWKEHVTRLRNKLAKSLAIVYKAREVLNKKALYTLYCTMFLPYISYCLEVWGTTYTSTMTCLITLQKKAIRLICNKRKREHNDKLFYETKILKLLDMVKLKVCTIIYKAKNRLLLNNILKLLDVNVCRNYNTKNMFKLKIKYARTNCKQMCTSIIGINWFNMLSDELCNAKSVKSFVRKYKKVIIANYDMSNKFSHKIFRGLCK